MSQGTRSYLEDAPPCFATKSPGIAQRPARTVPLHGLTRIPLLAANDDFDGEDEDGYYENVAGGGEHSHDEQVDHESGLARSLPAIDAAVRAVYYGDGVVYDGWIVDQSPDGMVYISFEG